MYVCLYVHSMLIIAITSDASVFSVAVTFIVVVIVIAPTAIAYIYNI